MLLEVAVGISSLAFLAFIIGAAFDRPEMVMIGAIIMIAVGGTAMIDGVQVKTGEVHNTTNNSTVIENQYEDIQTHSEFPLGLVTLFLGTVMLFYGAGEASEQ